VEGWDSGRWRFLLQEANDRCSRDPLLEEADL
jgi:hypothetical protein